MYQLSDKQIDFILNDISARGIKLEDLQYNLLDHVCCIIEQDLEAGGDFEAFYAHTIKRFYKNELYEIEEEAIQLLTYKNYYAMKKIMILCGAAAAALLTMGIVLKFLHAPGASFGLVTGITTFSLLFLPLVFLLKVKETQNTRNRLITALGTGGAILMSMGVLFKIMHWPGANVCLISGTAAFSLIFLPLVFVLKTRELPGKKDKLVFSLGLLATIVMSVSILFKIMHWAGAELLGVTVIPIIGLLFLPVYFFSGINNLETRLNTIITSVLIIGGSGLLLSLVRVPRNVDEQLLAETNRFVQNQQILAAEQQHLKTPMNNALATEINNGCEELKSYLLENETGHKTVDADFKDGHVVIRNESVEKYLGDEAPAGEKLKQLRHAVEMYNAGIAPTQGVQTIPLQASILEKADDKIVTALNDLVRIQMIVAQNESALAYSK